MENKFKIAKYIKTDNGFEKDGYDEYSITYLKGLKVYELRIVVNGFLTKQTINIVNCNSGYKDIILLAIKEYIDDSSESKNRVTKFVNLTFIKSFYSKKIVDNIKNYLLPINKEESRDKLTEFGLVNLNK